MIAATQMRPGMVIKFNNDLFSVFSVNHRTPGNLRGFVQAKMRNLRSGTMIEHRFSSEDRGYSSVTLAARTSCDECVAYENHAPILILRQPKVPFIWALSKNYD